MKKYLLGLFALVMAVSLSAFTSAKSSNANEESAPLYWYLYDASTGTTGAYLGHGERSDFFGIDCNKLAGIECRRGYPITALVNQANPEQNVIDPDDNDENIKRQ